MNEPLDWSLYPNFRMEELRCKHTGECDMHPDMMHVLQDIRNDYGRPMFLSSGFRSVKHPVERMKETPGEHTFGMAVDILCHGAKALQILRLAQAHGINRIGVHQKGNPNARYIHIAITDKFKLDYPPAIWTY